MLRIKNYVDLQNNPDQFKVISYLSTKTTEWQFGTAISNWASRLVPGNYWIEKLQLTFKITLNFGSRSLTRSLEPKNLHLWTFFYHHLPVGNFQIFPCSVYLIEKIKLIITTLRSSSQGYFRTHQWQLQNSVFGCS